MNNYKRFSYPVEKEKKKSNVLIVYSETSWEQRKKKCRNYIMSIV